MLLAGAGWLVAVVAATSGGIAVVGLVGEGLTGQSGMAMSADQIRAELATSTPAAAVVPPSAAAPSPTATPAAPSDPASAGSPPSTSPDQRGNQRAISTRGGSFVAQCAGGLVTLRSLFPHQGFHLDDDPRGPARSVQVEFESYDLDVKVTVACDADGRPKHSVEHDREYDSD